MIIDGIFKGTSYPSLHIVTQNVAFLVFTISLSQTVTPFSGLAGLAHCVPVERFREGVN